MEKGAFILVFLSGVFLCLSQGQAPPRCMLPERTNGEVFSITGYTGRIFDEGLPIGEQVTISLRSCKPGYTPQRYVRAGCSNVGEWTVPVPICERGDSVSTERTEGMCAKPGYISRVVQYVNGADIDKLSSYPHDELPEGTFLVSRCSLPEAYVMQGSANRTCAEGIWSGQEPRCVRATTEIYFHNNQSMQIRSNGTIVIYPQSLLRIHCRMPSWSNARAHLISDNGPNAYYSDDLGTSQMVISMNPPRPQYSGRYTCQSDDRNISHSVFVQFAAVDCDQPREPTNGEVVDNDPHTFGLYPMGKQIMFTCNHGYSRDGASRSTCVLGEWSHHIPRCIRTSCPELQPPTHGTKIGGNRVGGAVFFMCDQGYHLQGESFLECLPTGKWSHPLPTCIYSFCAKPGYISHVVQYVNGADTDELGSYPHDELPEGTFLVSRCSLPGAYVMQRSTNRTCVEGSWSGQEPRCVSAATEIYFQNSQPMQIRSNGTIVIYPQSPLIIYCRMPSWSRAKADLTSDNGPYAHYSDDLGTSQMVITMSPPRPQYSGRYTCRSRDGTMSHSVFIQFAAIDCVQPTTPTNGAVLDNDPQPHGRYPMGKQIMFTCNSGYNRDGASRSTCVLGQWSHRVPQCIRPTCPHLQTPTHGSKIGGNRVGEAVHFRCDQGYHLQGESFLECLPTENWSHPHPTCIEIIEPEGPCDVITCESWQRCVILPSNVGICGCISPRNCPAPAPDQSEVCGTDGKNYTSICQLKARACILSIDTEQASSTQFCINGVPEFVRTPAPIVPIANEWSSSSFESVIVPDVPSVVQANESPGGADVGPLEAQTSPPSEPRSYSFCDADQCPTSTAEELCQNSAAIVIAYVNRWEANTGILEMEIYEVMFGEMPTWTRGSYQDVAIDVSAAPEHGCICPPFHTDEPYIIGFSRDPSLNDTAQLVHTDIVLLYSITLQEEIVRQLEATCPELQPPTHGNKIGGNRVGDSVIIGCNQGYHLQGDSFLDCLRTGNWSHPLPKCIDYKPCGVAGNVLADDDHEANENAWPWLSVVHRNSSTGPTMICSGTLLCPQWVLTTSSCFGNFPDGEVLGEVLWSFEEDKEITVTVTLGEYNVSVEEDCEQTISVDRIILHDQYNYDLPHDYDVALLHLSKPVELNSCARTICLPSETDTPNDPTIVGWGTASGLLQYTHDIPIQFPMPLVDQTKCQTVHLQDRSDLQSFDVTDRMLCAGKRFGTDPLCQGDHGSPLMYRRSRDDKWAIVGINTKGESCSRRNRYGIYSRIDDDLTQWINNVTSNCANDHIPSDTML